MSQDSIYKYAQFFIILCVFVVADQWTKIYASQWLATQRPGSFSHNISLEVPEDTSETTVEAFLRQTLKSNSDEEIGRIAQYYTRYADGGRITAQTPLKPGEKIEITQREVVVIDGYWDFQYTRNPGAAFGILADKDSEFRKPFFILVGIIALVVILMLMRGIVWRQQLLVWALSMIAAGAIGNFIDRIRFGYVIDFIVWKYTDEYRWPTFNIADVAIVVGVGLMMIEVIRDFKRQKALDAAGSESAEEAVS